MGKLIDLTGQKFERLTVINRAEDYIAPSGQKQTQWLCKCDCGNYIIVRSQYLKDGRTSSCGCLRSEMVSNRTKKYNDYNLSGAYGVGYTTNTNKPFYFDIEDYDKIKNYCWYESRYGYAESNIYNPNNRDKPEHIKMHKIILHVADDMCVDHKNHNKLDNRKQNLRNATYSNNNMNCGIRSNNTTGVTGVYLNKDTGNWYARIKIDGNIISLGSFNNFDNAVKARKKAEEKYFGEWSYDNSKNSKNDVVTSQDICNNNTDEVDLSWLDELA